MVEVGSKSDEALSRVTFTDLFEEVGEAPPLSATLFSLSTNSLVSSILRKSFHQDRSSRRPVSAYATLLTGERTEESLGLG